MAQGQHIGLVEKHGERGLIYFSGKEILAINNKEPYLFISPEEIKEKEETAKILSEVTGKKSSFFLNLANIKGSFYNVIEKNITIEKVEEINNLNLSGVYIGYENKRYYPAEKTASQIIGFINQEGIGQYGLESYYDEELKGKLRIEEREKNPYSFLLNISEKDSIDGASLELTIDYNIQFMTEKILKKGIEEYDAEGGEIIIMDPNSGAIIAMSQFPSFDPNNYKNESIENFQNSSIQKIFEPGSIFKPITMAIAINEGVVTPETIFNDDLGYVQFGTYRVSNLNNKAWGEVSMNTVLERSINTGVIFAEKKVGHQKFYNYLLDFGLFEKTNIDLAGEVYSKNNELKKALDNKIEVSFATTSFGQGIAMTPLQVITAFSAIVNGGTLYKPYIVKKINNKEIEPKIKREDIISEETSLKIRNMLINVIENGFGHLAQIEGYYIGGKTGTSQVPYASLGINKSGYSDHTWQTFMGFAPALDPSFIILVKLDNAQKVKTSEYSAVPIFNELSKYIIDYLQIPPNNKENLDK
jgi:cell division protein FtsI/penicillin-binding protein 2